MADVDHEAIAVTGMIADALDSFADNVGWEEVAIVRHEGAFRAEYYSPDGRIIAHRNILVVVGGKKNLARSANAKNRYSKEIDSGNS